MSTKSLKKVLSVILSAAILFSSIFVTGVITVSADSTEASKLNIWDGTIATEFASGSGTSTDPYIINTPQQLALCINSHGQFNSSGDYFKLGRDIYLNDITIENWATDDTVVKNEWFRGEYDSVEDAYYYNYYSGSVSDETIDTSKVYSYSDKATWGFRGTLDGNGHIVYGIWYPDDTLSFASGLIPYIRSGDIKDIGISDSRVVATTDKTVDTSGNSVAGAIVGATAYWAGSPVNITGCFSQDSFIKAIWAAGGILGYSFNNRQSPGSSINILNCYSTIPSDSIDNTYNNNNQNGIIGYSKYSHYTINNCYSVARPVHNRGKDEEWSCWYYNSKASSTASYWDKYVLGQKTLAAFQYAYSNVYSATAFSESLYNTHTETVDGAETKYYTYTALSSVTDMQGFAAKENMPELFADGTFTVTTGYPILTKFKRASSSAVYWDGSLELPEAGEGTAESPYEIANGAQLAYALNCFGDGKYYKLTANIYLNNVSSETWMTDDTVKNEWFKGASSGYAYYNLDGSATGKFNGYLDGDGHYVYGIYYADDTDSYSSGLIPSIDAGTIQKIGIKNSKIVAVMAAGGIAGYIYANTGAVTIDQCFANSDIYVKATKTETSKTSGGGFAGGILGYMDSGSGTTYLTDWESKVVTIKNTYSLVPLENLYSHRISSDTDTTQVNSHGIFGRNSYAYYKLLNCYSVATIAALNETTKRSMIAVDFGDDNKYQSDDATTAEIKNCFQGNYCVSKPWCNNNQRYDNGDDTYYYPYTGYKSLTGLTVFDGSLADLNANNVYTATEGYPILTVFANNIETATVTVSANGGSFADGTTELTSDLVVGEAIAIEEPTRANYKFLGWSTAADGSNIVTKATREMTNLYAKWLGAYEETDEELPETTSISLYTVNGTTETLLATYSGVPGEAVTVPNEFIKEEYNTPAGNKFIAEDYKARVNKYAYTWYLSNDCVSGEEFTGTTYPNFDIKLYCTTAKTTVTPVTTVDNQELYVGFDNYEVVAENTHFDSSIASITTEAAYSGFSSLKAIFEGAGTTAYELKTLRTFNIKNGKTYIVSVTYKADTDVTLGVGVADQANAVNTTVEAVNTTAAATGDAWNTVTLKLDANADSDSSVLAGTITASSAATVYVDNIVVYSVVSGYTAVKAEENALRVMMAYGENANQTTPVDNTVVIAGESKEVTGRGLLFALADNQEAVFTKDSNSVEKIVASELANVWNQDYGTNAAVFAGKLTGFEGKEDVEIAVRGYVEAGGEIYYSDIFTFSYANSPDYSGLTIVPEELASKELSLGNVNIWLPKGTKIWVDNTSTSYRFKVALYTLVDAGWIHTFGDRSSFVMPVDSFARFDFYSGNESYVGTLGDLNFAVPENRMGEVISETVLETTINSYALKNYKTVNSGTVNYVFITDIHVGSANTTQTEYEEEIAHRELTRTRMQSLVDMANDESNDIDFIVVGGDNTYEYSSVDDLAYQEWAATLAEGADNSLTAYYTYFLQYIFEPLKSSTKPVFILSGNHDAYIPLTDENWDTAIVEEFSPNVVQDEAYTNASGESISRYFYYDIADKKTRVICLDFTDFRGGLYSGYMYAPEQVEWLANVAMTAPAGWDYVYISHAGFRSDDGTSPAGGGTNSDVVRGIITAFNNKTTYTSSELTANYKGGTITVSVDYTESDANDKILVLQHGHEHKEYIEYSAEMDLWQISSTRATRTGFIYDLMAVCDDAVYKFASTSSYYSGKLVYPVS